MIVTSLVVLPLCAPSAPAQKAYENTEYGFAFKPPKDWNGVPLQPGEEVVVAKFATDKKQQAGGFQHSPSLEVYVFTHTAVTGGAPPSPEEQLREAMRKQMGLADVDSFLKREGDVGEPKDGKSSKKVPYQTWQYVVARPSTGGGTIDIGYAVYVFRGVNLEVLLKFDSLGDKFDKVSRDFDRTAKSFEWIEKEDTSFDTTGMSEREIELRKLEDALPAGWRALWSTKKRYRIFTDAEDEFVTEASRHLEAMRDYYEEVFPPDHPIDAVSIVRICANQKEYMAYGAPGGSGGYWSPSQKELVFFDNKDFNRNEVFCVVSHEAFHQYIYYFYGELSPHSWYNEGHGDYFGGVVMNKTRTKVVKIDPLNYSSYPRLNRIKEAIQTGKSIPLKEFMHWTQAQYYGAPPENYQYGYPQGWSIVYFLRKAKEEHVRLKPQWDSILDDYLKNLVAARDEKRAENPDLPPGFLNDDEIQKEAYDRTFGSWTDKDWQEFEEAWKNFYT